MRTQKYLARTKLLAAVLAVNGFAFYAAGQTSSSTTTDTSSSSTSSAAHDLSQGSVVPNSGQTVVPPQTQTNTSSSSSTTTGQPGAFNSAAGASSPVAGTVNATGNAVSGQTNGGSVNNTGVVNPNVNPNEVTNTNGVNANTPAGATTSNGTTTISNGATIDTSTSGTARGTVNPNGTVNNGAADASNPAGVVPSNGVVGATNTAGVGTAGVGAANTAGVGAANTAGVGAANTAGAGAGNTAGAGAANSAGAGAGNTAGAGAANSAGVGAGNTAGVGASNSAGVGASSASDNAQTAGSTSNAFNNGSTNGAFNNGSTNGAFNNGSTTGAFNNGANPGANTTTGTNGSTNTNTNTSTTTTGGSSTTTGGIGNTGTNTTTGSSSTGGSAAPAGKAASGAGHVDASSVIDHPIYLDDQSVYSRPKPNKDVADPIYHQADASTPADQAVPAANTAPNGTGTSDRVTTSNRVATDSAQQDVSVAGRPLSSAHDPGQVRQVLASTTEAALSKNSCDRLAANFDKADRQRLDLSSAKFDDLNMKIDQFNQDWREKYGRDFTVTQPEVVFNDEYRVMPGGITSETARTASDTIAPSTDTNVTSTRSDYNDSQIVGNKTGQLLPRDATYHDGTKMKADGTIQRNDISSVNARPGQVNVPTGNQINDRDPSNHDRPDTIATPTQRDVIDASAQPAAQRVDQAYSQTSAPADTAHSKNLEPGESAEIDTTNGTVRRDAAGDGVLLRGPNDQAAADVQTASVPRALVIIPASYGLPQLSVPMIKEAGEWKLCVPDNQDGQRLHDCLLRHISMMDDQKATWPSDVNDATRMVNHQIMAAIYESQQKSPELNSAE